MSGGSPPVKNASRSPSGADPRYLAMQNPPKDCPSSVPPIDAEGSARRLRVGDDGVRAVHRDVLRCVCRGELVIRDVAELPLKRLARPRALGRERARTPGAPLIEQKHAERFGRLRQPSVRLDRTRGFEPGAALQEKQRGHRRAVERWVAHFAGRHHLPHENLQRLGSLGLRREVIERHRKEVLGQLAPFDADALADAVGNRVRGRYDDAGRHRGRRLCRTGSRVI